MFCCQEGHSAQSLISTKEGEQVCHATWFLRGSPDDLQISSICVSSCCEASQALSTLITAPHLCHSHCLLPACQRPLSVQNSMQEEAVSLTGTVMK